MFQASLLYMFVYNEVHIIMINKDQDCIFFVTSRHTVVNPYCQTIQPALWADLNNSYWLFISYVLLCRTSKLLRVETELCETCESLNPFVHQAV